MRRGTAPSQPAAPVPPARVQLVPRLVGRTSVTWTFCAVAAPELLTVIRKPIGSPALTGLASAVFRTWMDAARTVTWAVEVSEPALLVLTLAVLLTGLDGAVAPVVGLVMWMVR